MAARFFQINIAQIVIHKTGQPDAVVNFFDSDRLTGEGYAEENLRFADDSGVNVHKGPRFANRCRGPCSITVRDCNRARDSNQGKSNEKLAA